MSKTVFTKVDYDLDALTKFIGLGEIGLPDIQRPFVWNNAKVRDLFDSMYRGYPIGYLLFWQNALTDEARHIGNDSKQKSPRLVIVDGQQRLTSLYAVVKNVPVLRESFQTERIQIAFNPIDERFEVIDAAILRDKAFLPDISMLWAAESKITRIIREYLANLRTGREISDSEESLIEDRILKLQGLLSFPFTALELAADIDEEAVSEVFVRINSKGTPLNQADFILTLMSVFWDEGRTDLEQFCRNSRVPSKGTPSSYNHFIDPYPDQMLRVGVGVAFKRARLKYVYSILRGKDLETGHFSEKSRVDQFELLKQAQEKALNLLHWHDFMNCIRQAGFRSGKMISSQNNLLFSYVLYLIGRTEYRVPENDLRAVISRWFFMSAVTGRFTGSPESAMEFDLARLREAHSPEDFIQTLSSVCEVTLTKDFWGVSLPTALATSSPRSPSLFAYQAALVLLDARVLFSKQKVSDLLSPLSQGTRAGVERHHLFPKAHLSKQGITAIRDTNQIANYALVEWGDNSLISDQAPSDYLPLMKSRFPSGELEKMYRWHGLPANWEQLDYRIFLQQRRELMAQVIADGYATLASASVPAEAQSEQFDLSKILATGESESIEFKSTLRTNLHTGNADPRMELGVLKTLGGFLNCNGGSLIVGMSDEGTAVGIRQDGFPNEDKMALHLVNIVKARMGVQAMTQLHIHFEDHEEYRVMVVRSGKATSPVFVKEGDVERFYVRTGPSTTELSARQTQEYIRQRFK